MPSVLNVRGSCKRHGAPSAAIFLLTIPHIVVGCGTFGSVRSPDGDRAQSAMAQAKRFRELLADENYDTARAMMAEDPRRWFDKRSGAGHPWRIGPGIGGPWSKWDKHVRKTNEPLYRDGDDRSARFVFRELNDYYRLLERGGAVNSVTYLFDGDGRIEGLLISAVGERHLGRTAEFIAWAKRNDPTELEHLMPGGRIDPSGDHPLRFRRLLNRWRGGVGLKPVE